MTDDRQMMRARPILFALLLAASARAWAGCGDEPFMFDEWKLTAGPQHHPLGRAMPATEDFRQPDRCTDGIWFFDENLNGEPDAGEVRLFGSNRVVDCGSCHGESPDIKSSASASVFLRQDAVRMCLVCHRK